MSSCVPWNLLGKLEMVDTPAGRALRRPFSKQFQTPAFRASALAPRDRVGRKLARGEVRGRLTPLAVISKRLEQETGQRMPAKTGNQPARRPSPRECVGAGESPTRQLSSPAS